MSDIIRKIIVVVPAFFLKSYGGAQRQALILAEALGRKSVDVTLVTPALSDQADAIEVTSFGRTIRKKMKAYPNLGGRNFGSFLHWTLWFPRTFSGLEWQGIPIYVFHSRLHALGPVLAAILNRVTLAIKLGGGGEASEFAALRNKKYVYGHLIERLLRIRTNLFVANSHQIANELRSLHVPEGRIQEFPNGVMLPERNDIETALDSRSGDRFIYCGRIVSDKNISDKFDAAMILLKKGMSLTLVLAGDGPERRRLEPLAQASPFASAVRFPGFLSDVYAELMPSDYFVSASTREGQSNALLEAMSAGLIPDARSADRTARLKISRFPICSNGMGNLHRNTKESFSRNFGIPIVYPASGVSEMVTDGVNGFIISHATPEGLAEGMKRAMAMTPAERREMALRARQFVEDNIGIDAIADRTIAMFGRT